MVVRQEPGTAATPAPSARDRGRWLLLGFVAGALAVPLGHQVALGILHLAGLTPRTPWPMTPVPPFGVPQLVSLSFWGGLWGIPLAALLYGEHDDGRYWARAIGFGAVALSLAVWFVVGPLKGQPLPNSAMPMLAALLLNGVWGAVAAAFLLAMGRRDTPRNSESI